MRHQQDGGSVFPRQALHVVDDFAAGFFVQRCGWLIRQQHRGIGHQCAGNGHTLALTTGQLVRLVVDTIFQADGGQHVAGPPAHFRPCVFSTGAQTKLHVLNGGQRTQQIVLLENEPDLLAYFFQYFRPCVFQFFTQDLHTAFLGGTQSTDQGQHGCFTGPGGTSDDHDLAGLDFG